MDDKINDCAKCGDDAMLTSYNGKHMVSIRRKAKCKFYKPRKNTICQTEICTSAEEAIAQWNQSHGKETT